MVVAYLRVSTGRQTLTNQRHEITRFAGSRNMVVDCWVTEVVSGSKKRRETRGNGKAVKSRGHVDRDRTFQVKPHAYRYYDDRGGTARKRRVPVQYQGSLFF